MRKPKSIAASPTFFCAAHSLSDGARDRLIELLGYGNVGQLADAERDQMPGMKLYNRMTGKPQDLVPNAASKRLGKVPDIGKFILEIEAALGVFVDGAKHIDNRPRPADYATAFSPIADDAQELREAVGGLNDFFRDEFKRRGVDIHAIEESLLSLYEVSASVKEEMKSLPSAGAKKNIALKLTVKRLKKIFLDRYRGPYSARKVQGAFNYVAEWEQRRRDFIKCALSDARYVRANGHIDRLIRDPECALPEDRLAFSARKSRQVHRREQKGGGK